MLKFKEYIKENLFLLSAILVTLIGVIIASVQFISFRYYEAEFVVRHNVEVQKMSDYLPKLKGTIGDADIYVIGTQKEDEPSILVMGGVHPNETAGQMAATLLMEQIKVTKGTVYIITETNKSGYTHSHPQEATPMYYDVPTQFGTRTFKYGSRATNPVDQWPISDVYAHSATGQKLSGQDTRNLNRSFPGNKNGNYTELVATSIINLIKEKNIVITLDFHEASPEYGTNNALIYHEKVEKMGLGGRMNFQYGMLRLEQTDFAPIKMEISPANLRGLTHREIGDNTDALPFLTEASNITQGRIRGAATKENIVSGYDKFYERATKLGILEVDHSKAVSLHERTARHVETFNILINAYNDFASNPSSDPERSKYQRGLFEIDMNGLSFRNVMDNGIGKYLRNPIREASVTALVKELEPLITFRNTIYNAEGKSASELKEGYYFANIEYLNIIDKAINDAQAIILDESSTSLQIDEVLEQLKEKETVLRNNYFEGESPDAPSPNEE